MNATLTGNGQSHHRLAPVTQPTTDLEYDLDCPSVSFRPQQLSDLVQDTLKKIVMPGSSVDEDADNSAIHSRSKQAHEVTLENNHCVRSSHEVCSLNAWWPFLVDDLASQCNGLQVVRSSVHVRNCVV